MEHKKERVEVGKKKATVGVMVTHELKGTSLDEGGCKGRHSTITPEKSKRGATKEKESWNGKYHRDSVC